MSPEIIYLILTLAVYIGIFSAAAYGREALLVLIGVYTVIANVVVGKLIIIHGIPFMATACLSGSLFWIAILLANYYEAAASKRAIFYSYGAILALVIIGTFVRWLPGGENEAMNNAMATIFSFMPMVLIGAFFSFGSSFTFTLFVENILKKKYPALNKIPAQAVIVALANLMDITVFCVIVYQSNSEPMSTLILASWIARLAVAACGIPFMLVLRRFYASSKFPILQEK